MQKHRKMYEEELVREIMVSTALCVREFLANDARNETDEVLRFVDANFRQIIFETLRVEREWRV